LQERLLHRGGLVRVVSFVQLCNQFFFIAKYLAAYNKWHGTELERWLSDHDIEYPKPADRKDLQKIVQDNWQSKIIEAYNGWDIPQLRAHLTDTGREIDKKQKENKNWLVQQVKSGWHETESTAQAAYGNVKDWIFDS
jgi:hypothetical protein